MHFPDDWIKPGEFRFDGTGTYLLPLSKDLTASDKQIHNWVAEVRDNIAAVRQKYLPPLFWMSFGKVCNAQHASEFDGSNSKWCR